MAEDPADAVAKMRAGLYRDLYKRGHTSNTYADLDPEEGVYAPTHVDDGRVAPMRQATKPYIPPTELSDNEALPFGNVVGAPLGF